jgi:hypothetical protein
MGTHLKYGEVTRKRPSNGLPPFVKEIAVKRGYADSKEPLSLYVTEDDIDQAYAGAGRGNGTKCVMAQAGKRLGAKNIYFYRTTAWIDFGSGPILRFSIANSIQRNIIDPFDNGKRKEIIPGLYPLMAPRPSNSLRERRKVAKKHSRKTSSSNPKKVVLAHTDRVVLAATA